MTRPGDPQRATVPRRTRISFTVTILTAFALLFLAAMGAVVAGYRGTGAAAARDTAERSLAQAADASAGNTRALIRPVLALSAVLPEFAPLAGGVDPAGRDTAALLALLAAEPAVQGISVGMADGTLRQVLRATALGGPDVPPVPAGAAYALREQVPGRPAAWTFLGGLAPGGMATVHDGGADPRLAQWYLQADDAAVHVSTLYDLPLFGRPGLSVSRRVPGGGAVVGLDMTLESLSAFLAHQRASPRSDVFLFTEEGILLAHQRQEVAAVPAGTPEAPRTRWTSLAAAADPVVRLVWRHYAQGMLPPGETRELAGPDGPLLVRLATLEDLAEPGMLVAVAAPLADFTAPVDAAVRDGTLLAALAFAAGLLAIGVLAWRIARPLTILTAEVEAIRRLELETPLDVNSRIAEIASLSEAMGGMKATLRLFGVYVPRDLVRKLMEEGGIAEVGGERRHVTVLFSDIDDFTTLAERMAPEELMRVASTYFEAVTDELLRNRATIDKYIGDAVMALWNAPRDDPYHARNACEAALRARLLTERLCEAFAARGWPRLQTRFGLHTGDAVVGNVGSSDRLAYTAMGGMVNLASRLEGMNKFYGSRILVSEATRLAAGPWFVTRPVDLVQAKGATVATDVHELLGLSVVDAEADAPLRPDAAVLARLPAWRAMVGHYRAARFDAAADELAAAGDPARDPLLALYAERIGRMRACPPEPSWSPVLRFTTK